MSKPTARITELCGEELLRAMAWWQHHQPYVQRLIDERDGGAAYPPSGSDCFHPELWRAPHWRWLKGRLRVEGELSSSHRADETEPPETEVS